MGDDKSLLAHDALRDINALAIHNIKLSRGRQPNQFLTYPVPEFDVGDKVLVHAYVIHCTLNKIKSYCWISKPIMLLIFNHPLIY